jgi:putative restriction endonuclease
LEARRKTNFKALNEGDLSCSNYIAKGLYRWWRIVFEIFYPSIFFGMGSFGIANGARDLLELKNRIYKYKKTDRLTDPDPYIGCIILSNPFYFEEKDWIPVPNDWNRNIVQGKTYDTDEIMDCSFTIIFSRNSSSCEGFYGVKEVSTEYRYGKEQLIRPRLVKVHLKF